MMNSLEAHAIAERLRTVIQPFCHRVKIVGSIHRRKSEGIKDIEIVAIPYREECLDASEQELLCDRFVWQPGDIEIIRFESSSFESSSFESSSFESSS